jgi:hypothetical protein
MEFYQAPMEKLKRQVFQSILGYYWYLRLRRARYSAQGVHVACVYTDLSHWHTGRKFDVPVYTTRDIYVKAIQEARYLPGEIRSARGAADPLMVLASPEIPAWLR